ncbi:MAG: hypothetical protein RIQ52_170 [Pseudomonadota bacterium]|jgi:hypothetical protein
MELADMLSLKRPSLYPELWLDQVRRWLPDDASPFMDAADRVMAFAVTVGNAGDTLYCCHLDTVHASAGCQAVVAGEFPDSLVTTDGECLGADDGAGVWLLLEMVAAQVPGTYLFHLGEEIGCLGSRWMVEHQASWLRQFRRAVSFDRPGTSDVITHFGGQRGCSDDFARNCCDALSVRLQPYVLKPYQRGGSTDVRHYIGLIPECTNISTGYFCQHGSQEWLDVRYIKAMRDAMIAVGKAGDAWPMAA